MFKLVEKFNKEVIGINRNNIQEMGEDEFTWFIGALREEISELIESYDKANIVIQIDSIIDLIYFAIGGLVRMGLSSDKIELIFKVVNNANMNKIKGKKNREIEHDLDAIKPKGWVDPIIEIEKIIKDQK